jgi:hypothetical protein
VFARQFNSRKQDLPEKVVRFFRKNILGEKSASYFPQYEFRPIGRSVFHGAEPHVHPSDIRVAVAPMPPPVAVVVQKPQPAKSVVVVNPVMADDVPLVHRIAAMDWQRYQQRLVTQVNAQQPAGCHVMAFAILPIELFTGEVGRFLMMACDFYSHAPCNTLLLPAMPAGAAQLQLPQHPIVTSYLQQSDAKAKILQLRTRVANEHHRVAVAIERGDVSELFKHNSNRADYKTELAQICKSVAINAFGLSAYGKHESHFGALLKDAKTTEFPQLPLHA